MREPNDPQGEFDRRRTQRCRVHTFVEERGHLQPLATCAYRPLVLPVERMTRRTVPHLLTPTVPAVPSVVVERRGLERYQQLIDSVIDEVA